MAKVSIIVPVYNVEHYIKRCIDSLKNQSLSDIEIILVDDESSDNCPKICDEYSKNDSRIKVIHKKNEGLGEARNTGLNIASGEFIAFLDSDDYVDLSMYENLYYMATKDKLDICYCDVYNFDYKGNYSLYPRYSDTKYFCGEKEIRKFSSLILSPDKASEASVIYPNMSWNAIYRGDIIRKYNIRFKSERKYVSEDVLFHLENLIYFNKIGWLPKPLVYHYMSNSNSLTNNITTRKIQASISMIDQIRKISDTIYKDDNNMERAIDSYTIKLVNDISSSIAFLTLNPITRFHYLYLFLKNVYNAISYPNSLILDLHKSKSNFALKLWGHGYIILSIIGYNMLFTTKRWKKIIKKALNINQF